MNLCRNHASLYGNSFTYTLLDYRAMRREAARRILFGTFTLGLGLFAWYQSDHD